ncbi:MAG: beta-xylosidase, partial [Moraxellaceae bacterium]
MNAGGANFNPAVLESGITMKDTHGDVLHAHGGGIIKVDDFYYWYGENRYDNQVFKSVRLYRSRTLQNWEFVKDILTDRSDADLNSAKIERPKIIYNRRTQQFVMWMHKEGSDNYGQARAAVAVADKIDGNFTYRGSFRPLDFMSR